VRSSLMANINPRQYHSPVQHTILDICLVNNNVFAAKSKTSEKTILVEAKSRAGACVPAKGWFSKERSGQRLAGTDV
jgi:hypothetical protein